MGYRMGRNVIVSQERKLLGVCAAIGNTLGVNGLWVRIAAIALTLFVTFWTIPVYLLCGWALTRAEKNKRADRSTRSSYIASPRSRYLSDTDRMLAHRDSELAREIDSLR